MPRALSRRTGRGRRRAAIGRGIVLSAGRIETAAGWARRGLGELTIAPAQGWTLISATGPPQARYPYNDPIRTLAGRPVSWRMRPALGFFVVGAQAVIVVHPPGRRPLVRWLIWTPRHGVVPTDQLPQADISQIVVVAGLPMSAQAQAARALERLLDQVDVDAGHVLSGALDILALPGVQVLTGQIAIGELPGARVISARPRHARAFARLLNELEQQRSQEEV